MWRLGHMLVARPCAPTRKDRRDRRDRQPPPEQRCRGGGDPASAKQLVYSANRCSKSCAEQRHKDSVREAAAEEEPCSKTVDPAVRGHLCHWRELAQVSVLSRQTDDKTRLLWRQKRYLWQLTPVIQLHLPVLDLSCCVTYYGMALPERRCTNT